MIYRRFLEFHELKCFIDIVLFFSRKSENAERCATLEGTREFINSRQPTVKTPWMVWWGIILEEEEKAVSDDDSEVGEGKEGRKDENPKAGRLIGAIGIPREGEIGYKLHPDFWGKGYMSYALRQAVNLFWRFDGKFSF